MISIFSLVRKPFNFDTWLDYHISIGVDYFFLKVEDTPELKELLQKYPNVFPIYDDESSKLNNYWTLIDRQKDFFNSIKSQLVNLNIDWIFHIDSDELLCVENIKSFLSEVDNKYNTLHFSNYEAVYDKDDLENPFISCNRFRFRKLLAYANGKPGAKVIDELSWSGPHRFSGNCYEVPPKKAVILHFESPTFTQWYEKFNTNSNIENDSLQKIPFNFYRKSIEVIRSGDIEMCKDFYRKNKIDVSDNIIKIFWTPMLNSKNINWSL